MSAQWKYYASIEVIIIMALKHHGNAYIREKIGYKIMH